MPVYSPFSLFSHGESQIDGFTFHEMPASELKKLITTVGGKAKCFKLWEELRKVEVGIKNY